MFFLRKIVVLGKRAHDFITESTVRVIGWAIFFNGKNWRELQ